MTSMSHTMNISLTPELEGYTRGLVQAGDYSSASEVMREALRLLKQKREREQKLTELRGLIQESLESGPPVTMTSEQLREMIHEHATQRRAEAGSKTAS